MAEEQLVSNRSDEFEQEDYPYEAQVLEERLERQEQLAASLLDKVSQMLLFPLSKTTRTTTEDGRQVTTEIYPAKWTLTDATKLYDTATKLQHQAERMRRELEAVQQRADPEALPDWVPGYLAAWGSTRPEGKRCTVQWAAEMSGTTASNVRNLRQDSARFARMEYMARHGKAEHIATLIDAGLHGNALTIFEQYMGLVKDGNAQAILKGMEWLGQKPTLVKLAGLSDDELVQRYSELLAGIGGNRGDSEEEGAPAPGLDEEEGTD